jgi:hypothetical protein
MICCLTLERERKKNLFESMPLKTDSQKQFAVLIRGRFHLFMRKLFKYFKGNINVILTTVPYLLKSSIESRNQSTANKSRKKRRFEIRHDMKKRGSTVS